LDSFFFSDFFVFIGFFFDLESVYTLKNFLNSISCSNYFFEKSILPFFDFRFFFFLNISILSMENLFFCFFLFIDLRFEAPLLYNKIRKSFQLIMKIFLFVI
jgi:hypothetical protein